MEAAVAAVAAANFTGTEEVRDPIGAGMMEKGVGKFTKSAENWEEIGNTCLSFKHNVNTQLLHHLEPVGCCMLYSGVSLLTKPANFLLPIWKQTTFSDCGIKSARVFHKTLPSSFTA